MLSFPYRLISASEPPSLYLITPKPMCQTGVSSEDLIRFPSPLAPLSGMLLFNTCVVYLFASNISDLTQSTHTLAHTWNDTNV